MRNPHGMPIWYERLTAEADTTIGFYEKVIGWTFGAAADDSPVDYRMIETGDGAVGGLAAMTPDMVLGGAKPAWLFYIGVDDVDAAVATVTANGGSVQMPAFDMAGVGRMALVADPQGVPFYVMRGAVDQPSGAWSRTGMGKCNWNELATPDPDAARAFYAAVSGWTYPERMTMPDGMGDYVFHDVGGGAGGERIGASMRNADGQAPGWTFYFRAPDIDAAAAAIVANGGAVHAGPMEVPGGDLIVVASDPEGVGFGVAAPGRGAAA